MTTTIKTKNSTTASSVPANGSLAQGELAVNIADRKIFVGDSSGNPTGVGFNSSNNTDEMTRVKTSDTVPFLRLKVGATSSNHGDMLNFGDSTDTDLVNMGLKPSGVTRSFYITCGYVGLRFFNYSSTNYIVPCQKLGADRDAVIDLGYYGSRFRNVYRSGSTYSASDRNKKQDIRDLTDAEARVAVAAKGFLKAFRYIDTVEAEGDDANIHFGIMAQDLKAAFEAEGLNADSYQVLETVTPTDESGVEETTYAVCYENLLAFIIAAI